MKINWRWMLVLTLTGAVGDTTQGFTQGNTLTPAVSVSTLEKEKKKLELDRLQLENEKLKFEIEKMKLQATAVPNPDKKEKSQKQGNDKEDAQIFQADASKKAEDLAKKNKEKVDLLILDFANAEVWHHGVRYSLHEFYSLSQDEKWPIEKRVDGRKPNGYPRYLYRVHNVLLRRYQDMDRGIIEIKPPIKEGDFNILTPEGISFNSSIGDIRTAFQSLYFSYDGQDERGSLKALKYKHSKGLSFSDKLEFLFDQDGKMAQIRYGVLDEH
jgi:hypothetical protein